MDELRLGRLETRVDEIKDDVADVKASQKVLSATAKDMNANLKELTQAVTMHVAGDDKIIIEIKPIIEEFKFQQALEQRKEKARMARNDKLKEWGVKLGIPATILGIVATSIKLLASS